MALGLSAAACVGAQLFACDNDAACGEHGGQAGICQPGGLCSFPDAECESGLRYGEYSGNLSGDCVPVVEGSGSGDGDGSGPGVTSNASQDGSTTQGGSATEGDTTIALDGPMSSSTTGDATDATTDPADGSSSGDASTTGPSSTSGIVPNGDPYGPCDQNAECSEGEICLPFDDMHSSCSTPCMADDECPSWDGWPADCFAGVGLGFCMLTCDLSGTNPCPEDDMECLENPGLMLSACSW